MAHYLVSFDDDGFPFYLRFASKKVATDFKKFTESSDMSYMNVGGDVNTSLVDDMTTVVNEHALDELKNQIAWGHGIRSSMGLFEDMYGWLDAEYEATPNAWKSR